MLKEALKDWPLQFVHQTIPAPVTSSSNLPTDFGVSLAQCWEGVVAELVERSLPIPEVRVRIQSSAKIYYEHLPAVNCIEKTKIKEKEAGNGQKRIAQ